MISKTNTVLRVIAQSLVRLRAAAARVLGLLASWGFMSALCLLAGCGLLIAGVHVILGLGWALIAGAAPALLAGVILLLGVIRGE